MVLACLRKIWQKLHASITQGLVQLMQTIKSLALSLVFRTLTHHFCERLVTLLEVYDHEPCPSSTDDPTGGLDALYIITTALSGSFSILAWVTWLVSAGNLLLITVVIFLLDEAAGMCSVLLPPDGLGPAHNWLFDRILFQ